ncbi:MAG TPA: acyl carrier protein [Hyphomicrobium sp.]|nr:acyl carrier protein [Hyphomicrobium sp.]
MTDSELAALVKASLFSVAPDLEGEAVEPKVPIRDQLEIDSMDFLNFIIDLHKRTGVEISESDYAQFSTLAGAVRFLKSRIGKAPAK